jgi:predicted LPLAT superfamily acyltransferase
MAVALQTLAAHGGGLLVVSGHQGEAERLAHLAHAHPVIVESTARSTRENVERSLCHFEKADQLAIAVDWFHARRASSYLRQLRPELSARVVPAKRQWRHGGWWIQPSGAVYEALHGAKVLVRSVQ